MDTLLCQALTEILQQVSLDDGPTTAETTAASSESTALSPETVNHDSSSSQTRTPRYCLVFLRADSPVGEVADGEEAATTIPVKSTNPLTEEEFHQRLEMERFADVEDMRKRILENINAFKSEYGVLQYLYSVLLTKVKLHN